jgi:hypothetical protein
MTTGIFTKQRKNHAKEHFFEEGIDIIMDDTTNNNCCSICLEELHRGDDHDAIIVQSKYCSHLHHKDCINDWMARGQNSCPCCREHLLPESTYFTRYRRNKIDDDDDFIDG